MYSAAHIPSKYVLFPNESSTCTSYRFDRNTPLLPRCCPLPFTTSGVANATRPLTRPVGKLNARDAEILAFERQWWKFAGAKEQAIRDKFAMSATRYYQVLNALIDQPEALAHDPLLVKRLRRLRASRQRQRSAKRLGIDLNIDA